MHHVNQVLLLLTAVPSHWQPVVDRLPRQFHKAISLSVVSGAKKCRKTWWFPCVHSANRSACCKFCCGSVLVPCHNQAAPASELASHFLSIMHLSAKVSLRSGTSNDTRHETTCCPRPCGRFQHPKKYNRIGYRPPGRRVNRNHYRNTCARATSSNYPDGTFTVQNTTKTKAQIINPVFLGW